MEPTPQNPSYKPAGIWCTLAPPECDVANLGMEEECSAVGKSSSDYQTETRAVATTIRQSK
jgi:hypothetical protein